MTGCLKACQCFGHQALGREIKVLFPDVELELVEAGHCPHDEVPDAFNNAVDKFYASMMKVTADATI